MVDTHAHIYSSQFHKDEIQDVIERAVEKGIEKIYMPNIDHTSIDSMLELENKYPGTCIPMMGLHPCHVKKDFMRELYIVEEWLSKKKFAAVGEIGTDLYWDTTYVEQQKEAFEIQLSLAEKHNLPVVIHCRNSMHETIDMINKPQWSTIRGIFHCFSGTAEQAKEIVGKGFLLGIGGVVTFKNSGLNTVLKDVSVQHLVLETDSPYLAPVPHRGKRNEPSYLDLILKKVSEIYGQPEDAIEAVTTRNASALFSL